MLTPDRRIHELPWKLTYRREIVQPIMDCARAGTSCAIVGIASVGKSNLLRFLLRPEVQQHYLDPEAAEFLFLYVDGNSASQITEHGACELILSAIRAHAEASEHLHALLPDLRECHERAMGSRSRAVAQRNAASAIHLCCDRLGLRLVILFDEFDGLLAQLDRNFFLNLRAIRDAHKYRLSYAISTRQAPTLIRHDVAEQCDSFHELFTGHVYALTPYSQEDAHEMIARLCLRHQVYALPADAQRLFTLSGGHAGLLSACFALSRPTQNGARLFVLPERQYVESNVVQEECNRVLLSLDPAEQAVLQTIAQTGSAAGADGDLVGSLEKKGLIRPGTTEKRYALTMPLLGHYLRH